MSFTTLFTVCSVFVVVACTAPSIILDESALANIHVEAGVPVFVQKKNTTSPCDVYCRNNSLERTCSTLYAGSLYNVTERISNCSNATDMANSTRFVGVELSDLLSGYIFDVGFVPSVLKIYSVPMPLYDGTVPLAAAINGEPMDPFGLYATSGESVVALPIMYANTSVLIGNITAVDETTVWPRTNYVFE